MYKAQSTIYDITGSRQSALGNRFDVRFTKSEVRGTKYIYDITVNRQSAHDNRFDVRFNFLP
jgi:hypothetical protein